MLNTIVMNIASFVSQAFPFECMQAPFMQRALLALLLIAPLAALSGILVVNSRMSFFCDAIGHSAFAGVALGVILGVSAKLSLPLTAVLVGLTIMALRRGSRLSSDTAIGVIFSAVAAFGLAIVARDRSAASNVQIFLFGDILMIDPGQIVSLAVLLVLFIAFQIFAFNRMLFIGINPMLASVNRIPVDLLQYLFAILLSLVVIFSVRATGVILATALLVVPAAAARNFARRAATMFYWALLISYVSCVSGLIVSAQEEINIPAGAAVVLCAVTIFFISLVFVLLRPKRKGDTEL